MLGLFFIIFVIWFADAEDKRLRVKDLKKNINDINNLLEDENERRF